MRKLLHANFLRLKKDKYFWTGIVVMALYAIADCAGQYNNMTRYEMTVSYDGVFFGFAYGHWDAASQHSAVCISEQNTVMERFVIN